MLAAAITVFGLALGQPIVIPECSKNEVSGGYSAVQTKTCQENYRTHDKNLFTDNYIIFPEQNAPTIGSLTFGAAIEGGVLEGLHIDTLGVSDQDYVLEQLTQKFGKPSSLVRAAGETASGVKFPTLQATWTNSSVVVEYGSGVYSMDRGSVRITTPELKRRLDAQDAAEKSSQTPL